jgi:hypothetical protein
MGKSDKATALALAKRKTMKKYYVLYHLAAFELIREGR